VEQHLRELKRVKDAEPRNLTSVAGVSKMFEHRYCDTVVSKSRGILSDKWRFRKIHDEGWKVSKDSIEHLLDVARSQKEAVQLSEKEFLQPYLGNLPKGKKCIRHPENISPIQFLDALSIALSSEYTALNFDYLSLHFLCMNALFSVRDEIGTDCREMLASGNSKSPLGGSEGIPISFDYYEFLGELPFYILKSHAQIGKLTGDELKWKVDDEMGRPASVLMVKTAKVLEKVAVAEGSMVVDRMRLLREECLRDRVGEENEESVSDDEICYILKVLKWLRGRNALRVQGLKPAPDDADAASYDFGASTIDCIEQGRRPFSFEKMGI